MESTEQKENIFCDDFRNLEMDIYEIEKELSKSNDIKLDYENKIKVFLPRIYLQNYSKFLLMVNSEKLIAVIFVTQMRVLIGII